MNVPVESRKKTVERSIIIYLICRSLSTYFNGAKLAMYHIESDRGILILIKHFQKYCQIIGTIWEQTRNLR